MGYEYEAAMTGNPLISWETCSRAVTSTLSSDPALFMLFNALSGCYGSKIVAAIMQRMRCAPTSEAGLMQVAAPRRIPPDEKGTAAQLRRNARRKRREV